MHGPAAELAERLARNAEAVCRHYLSNGRREGRYWLVGDINNNPGRSLYVRLRGLETGSGAAGKWTDAATGDHGDLLDLIAACRHLQSLRDTLEEARLFLSLPRTESHADRRPATPVPTGSPEAARRLFAMSKPITGTVAQSYLRRRGITDVRHGDPLRFHPRCWYRGDDEDPRDRLRDAWPAIIAAVTDLDGTITGAHRTWLDPSGSHKADISTPRRAMGQLLGNAVRFGHASDVLVAGEGIETMLSVRQILPALPMAAALSANHLAALILPPTLRRLYIAHDADPAGDRAQETLAERAIVLGIQVIPLKPNLGDFNDDLQTLGHDAVTRELRDQLLPDDIVRFA